MELLAMYVILFSHNFTSSLLDPYKSLSTLFSKNLSLRFYLIARDEIPRQYKTIHKVIVLCVLIFTYCGKVSGRIFLIFTADGMEWKCVF
jgi:hypothetical protein